MSYSIHELLAMAAFPPVQRGARWLIVGVASHAWHAALTQRGVIVTHAAWDQLGACDGEKFAVTVAQNLFNDLRHPLLALETLCAVTEDYALLHARSVLPPDPRAPQSLLCLDESGWQCNRTALARMARSAGFARVELLAETADEVWLKASRHWDDYPAEVKPSLTIRRVFNPRTGLDVFPRNGRLALIVTSLPADARRWDVRAKVGGYGVQPIYVGDAGEASCKQVNVAVPPGVGVGVASVEVWYRQLCANEYLIKISEDTSADFV